MLQSAEPADLGGLRNGHGDVALFFRCENVDDLHEQFTGRGV